MTTSKNILAIKILCWFLGHRPYIVDLISTIVDASGLCVAKQTIGCKRNCGFTSESSWVCSKREAEIYDAIKEPMLQVIQATLE